MSVSQRSTLVFKVFRVNGLNIANRNPAPSWTAGRAYPPIVHTRPYPSKTDMLPHTGATQRRHSSVQPQSSNALPQSLLSRRSAYSRPLPPLSVLTSSYRWLRTLPIFIAIITLSALGIFNYQKVNSPIIAANLYSLRTNPRVRELLGDEVYFASKWAWIWGQINLVQGRVDVSFDVKGTRDTGTCRFRARRFGGKNGNWKTEEWSLRIPSSVGEREENVVQLLENSNGYRTDPMEGATF